METFEMSTGGGQDDDKFSGDEDTDENDYEVIISQLQDNKQ